MPGPSQVTPVQQSETKSASTGSSSNTAGDAVRVQAKIPPQTRYPPGVLKHRLSHGSQTGARRSVRRDDNPGSFPLAVEKLDKQAARYQRWLAAPLASRVPSKAKASRFPDPRPAGRQKKPKLQRSIRNFQNRSRTRANFE